MHFILKASFTILIILGLTQIDEHEKQLKEISKALQTADYELLSTHLNNSVDLMLPAREGTFSKTQCVMILKDFFHKHQPESFTIKHKGNSTDKSVYAIGMYKTKEETFRLYLLLKKTSGHSLIHQMHFEAE